MRGNSSFGSTLPEFPPLIIVLYHHKRYRRPRFDIATMAVGAFINSGNPLLFSPSQRRSVSYRRCGPRVGVKRSAVRAAVPAIPALSSLPMPDPKVLQTSVKAISKLLTTLFLGVIAARRGLLEPQTLTVSSEQN